MVILQNTIECMSNACDKLEIDDVEIVAIGVTNQRETTVLWDSETGEPLCRAIGMKILILSFSLLFIIF